MSSVSLLWLAKTEKGWKRFPVVIGGNGRIKRGVVSIKGRQFHYPDGHFELRYHEGRKTK